LVRRAFLKGVARTACAPDPLEDAVASAAAPEASATTEAPPVVSEWSCAYTLPSSGDRMIFRGTEWYVMRNQRIAEVRAYYHYDENSDCELGGFPYADRSYLQK
jgi:hypothetical protein